MDVKDVGSSRGETFTHDAGVGEPKASPDPLDVFVEKLDRNEEDVRKTNPEIVWNETVCIAANLVVRSSVPCEGKRKDRDDLFMPEGNAAVEVFEA